ncbi:MAG: hypothetical protein GKR96_05640 [Gammaproteobacteria bacterium]|nr:hypothetical protein [Gammaproteobacteria bacterium]
MAIISSHILDSINGVSAIGVRSQLFRIGSDGSRINLFDIETDNEGRISELVVLKRDEEMGQDGEEYELVFHSAAYFSTQVAPQENPQAPPEAISEQSSPVMRTVVIRFSMIDPDKRYHMPVMLAPYSYSVWWSR